MTWNGEGDEQVGLCRSQRRSKSGNHVQCWNPSTTVLSRGCANTSGNLHSRKTDSQSSSCRLLLLPLEASWNQGDGAAPSALAISRSFFSQIKHHPCFDISHIVLVKALFLLQVTEMSLVRGHVSCNLDVDAESQHREPREHSSLFPLQCGIKCRGWVWPHRAEDISPQFRTSSFYCYDLKW